MGPQILVRVAVFFLSLCASVFAAECPADKSSNIIENETKLYSSKLHWSSDYFSILGGTQYVWAVQNKGPGVQRYLWAGPEMHNDRLPEGATDKVCLTLGQPVKNKGQLHYGRGNDEAETDYWAATKRKENQNIVVSFLFSLAKTGAEDPPVRIQMISSVETLKKRNRFRFEIQNTSQDTSPGILLSVGPEQEDLIQELENIPGLKFISLVEGALNPTEMAKSQLEEHTLGRLPFGLGPAGEAAQAGIDKAVDLLKAGLKPGHKLVVSFEAEPAVTLKQTQVTFLIDGESVAGATAPMFMPEGVNGIDIQNSGDQ